MKAGFQLVLFLASYSRNASCVMVVQFTFFESIPYLCNSFLGMFHACVTSSLDVFLNSLSFQFTSFESSPFRLTSFRSSPFQKRPPARLCGRSRACVVCQFQLVRFFSLLELAPGFDLAPFRKNAVRSSPRPRCLGVHNNFRDTGRITAKRFKNKNKWLLLITL